MDQVVNRASQISYKNKRALCKHVKSFYKRRLIVISMFCFWLQYVDLCCFLKKWTRCMYLIVLIFLNIIINIRLIIKNLQYNNNMSYCKYIITHSSGHRLTAITTLKQCLFWYLHNNCNQETYFHEIIIAHINNLVVFQNMNLCIQVLY